MEARADASGVMKLLAGLTEPTITPTVRDPADVFLWGPFVTITCAACG